MKVKKNVVLGSLLLAVIFAFTLIFGSLTSEAAEKVYRMKIQSAYPRGDLSMELLKELNQTPYTPIPVLLYMLMPHPISSPDLKI